MIKAEEEDDEDADVDDDGLTGKQPIPLGPHCSRVIVVWEREGEATGDERATPRLVICLRIRA